MASDGQPVVVAVSRDGQHGFSKPVVDEITLLAGLGVEGDAHAGAAVQHLSRIAADPTQPNLRQVHLIQSELHDELIERGFRVGPGELGENVTTRGIDLLGLPRGAVLRIGSLAAVQITGLRNPCAQINRFQPGLLKAVLDTDDEGRPVRKAGVMAIVMQGGPVRAGDTISVERPAGPQLALDRV